MKSQKPDNFAHYVCAVVVVVVGGRGVIIWLKFVIFFFLQVLDNLEEFQGIFPPLYIFFRKLIILTDGESLL